MASGALAARVAAPSAPRAFGGTVGRRESGGSVAGGHVILTSSTRRGGGASTRRPPGRLARLLSQLPTRSRRRHVTDERVHIAPEMVGLRLGSFWKRAVALWIDAAIVLMLMGMCVVAYPVSLIVIANPRIVPALFRAGDLATYSNPLAMEVARLIAQRDPGVTPEAVRVAVRDGDDDALASLVTEELPDIDFDEGGGMWLKVHTTVAADPDATHGAGRGPTMRTLILPVEHWPRLLGFAAFFLAYCTLWPRLLGGRTPGKALLGLRVARLDGQPLTLWDAFTRAGGYGASISMLALGFVEAAWDPNRQTVHDRIAGTVVVIAKPWPPSKVAAADGDTDARPDAKAVREDP